MRRVSGWAKSVKVQTLSTPKLKHFPPMSPILSIIVPSYNMEKYLPKCLGSLVVAPDQMERLEVLVVNDGSKDRTSEIAHEFAEKWPGTFKVIDKANGNYGSCINAALPLATGKYVKVLDADDWFETAAFADYLRFLNRVKDIDLVVTDYDTVDENGCVTKQHKYEFDPTKEFSIEEFVASNSYLPMHALTYRTSLLQEMGYRQLEGVSYTDTEWSLIPLFGVHAVRYYSNVIYKYLYGRIGQTMDEAKLAQSWWMKAEVVLDLVKGVKTFEKIAAPHVAWKLDHKLFSLCENVYCGGVFGNRGCVVNLDLNDFDHRLKVLSPDFYESLSRVIYSRRLPYHYVRAWRNQSVLFPMMKRVCRLYSALFCG